MQSRSRWAVLVALAAIFVAGGLAAGTRSRAAAQNAAVSNGKIAFEQIPEDRGVYEDAEIYVMDPDGSNQVPLTDSPEGESNAVWSPDGTRLAFNRDLGESGGRMDIFVMNADGSNVRRLTDDPGHDSLGSWSPDGTRIVFSSTRNAGLARRASIWVMNADGSNQTELLESPYVDTMPSWSPDGTRIAFIRESASAFPFEIKVMNADGSNVTGTQQNSTGTRLVWSPDSTRIAFTRIQTDGVWVMGADGSNPTPLLSRQLTYVSDWSPDGTKILFTGVRESGDGGYELYVMDADGSDPVRLTFTNGWSIAGSWQRTDAPPATAPPTSTPATTPVSTLPSTGSSATQIALLLAFGLVAFGGLAGMISRRAVDR